MCNGKSHTFTLRDNSTYICKIYDYIHKKSIIKICEFQSVKSVNFNLVNLRNFTCEIGASVKFKYPIIYYMNFVYYIQIKLKKNKIKLNSFMSKTL